MGERSGAPETEADAFEAICLAQEIGNETSGLAREAPWRTCTSASPVLIHLPQRQSRDGAQSLARSRCA
jgi:hypothetical protein